MKYLIHSLGIIVMMIMITGCQTSRVALNPEYQRQITTADTIIEVKQKEIYAEIKDSNLAVATGGGLIPALIDSAVEHNRAKTSETLIQPIRDQLVNYDFRTEFKDTFESRTHSIDWLRQSYVEETDEITPSEIMARLNHSRSAILTLQTKYFLTPKFDGVTVESKISLFLPGVSDQSRHKPKPIYLNTFITHAPVSGAEMISKKKNAEYIAHNPTRLSEALENGCRHIIDMFVNDVQSMRGVEPETGEQHQYRVSVTSE